MRTSRHFGPPPNTGQSTTELSCGVEAAADHAQNRIDMGAHRVPNSVRVVVDAVEGGDQNEAQDCALHVEHVEHVELGKRHATL